jgi:hypothetical protein
VDPGCAQRAWRKRRCPALPGPSRFTTQPRRLRSSKYSST